MIGKKLIAGLSILAFLGFASFNNPAKAQENYKPKYDTPSHKVLLMEKSIKTPYPTLKTLDNFLDNSKTYIHQKEDYTLKEKEAIVEKIYVDILKKLPGITKRITKDLCYRTSLIYYAIGKENNLEFFPVIVEGYPDKHVYILWNNKNDNTQKKHNFSDSTDIINKGDVNIETILGQLRPDEYYFQDSTSKEKGGRILNETQFISIGHWQRAIEFIKKEQYNKALEDCNKAIELDSNSTQAYQVKGESWKKLEEYEKAINEYTKALELNPEHQIYHARGWSWGKLEEFEKKKEDYTSALELIWKRKENAKDSTELISLIKIEKRYLVGRYLTFEKMGNFEDAEKDREKLKELQKITLDPEIQNLYYFLRNQ